MCVYNLKKLGCVNDKQYRTETRSLRNTILQGKTVRVPLTEMRWILFLKYTENHSKTLPETPNLDWRLVIKIPWSMVAKAALKSNRTSKVTWPLFIFITWEWHSSPLQEPSQYYGVAKTTTAKQDRDPLEDIWKSSWSDTERSVDLDR